MGFFPSTTICKICLSRKPPPFIKFLLHDSDTPQYGVLDRYHGSYLDVTSAGLESIEEEEQVSSAILLPEKYFSIDKKTVIKYSWLQSNTKREFKEMVLPPPHFLKLSHVLGVHFKRYLYSAYSNKVIIWNKKGLTAAILGTDFQRIKNEFILSSITLNII